MKDYKRGGEIKPPPPATFIRVIIREHARARMERNREMQTENSSTSLDIKAY